MLMLCLMCCKYVFHTLHSVYYLSYTATNIKMQDF